MHRTLCCVCLLFSIGAGCGGSDPSSTCADATCAVDALPGGGDSATCVEAWTCTPWETDGTSDAATRVCVDANQCGTTATRPALTATLPALDPEQYECAVEPIVTRGCAALGCHGTETGRAYRLYARGRLRVTGQTIIEPGCQQAGTPRASETCIGSIECACWTVPQLAMERRRSFDAARGFALDDAGAQLVDMAQSQLLRQPQLGGGFAHAGVTMWSAGDPDYLAVKAWLEGATRGTPCNSRN
ncbi:MAG: hypothetical protein R3B06_17965 [Kofleriaceae bacterium]